MRMFRPLVLIASLALAGIVSATPPAAANLLVSQAVSEAQSGHKGVLVIFHASWCGWCKQMDKTFAIPDVKRILDKDYVILHLTVLENGDRKADENPGGAELLDKWGGKDSGIPYTVAMDYTGKVVANSKTVEGNDPKPQNIGYPAEPVEIQKFMEMLKLANPAISSEDCSTIQGILQTRAAEIKSHH